MFFTQYSNTGVRTVQNLALVFIIKRLRRIMRHSITAMYNTKRNVCGHFWQFLAILELYDISIKSPNIKRKK